ncbi:MAG: Ig-like domain-containing protein, partial [Longimicrobiales bacterium]|nr:Ig-like domain-containing protein [Longimicrobiales bacterium]
MIKRRAVLYVCALALAPLAACGGGDGATGPGGAENLVKVEGDQQSGIVGEALSVDPTVQVRNADGDPVSGVSVEFQVTSGGGSVSVSTRTTDAQGRASTTWTLGTSTATDQLLEASTGSLTATFSADPQPGPATTLEIASGDGQQVSQPSTTLPDPLVVEVSDTYGNPVEGVSVEFTTSNGSVSPSQATTDASGRAQTTATVGAESELEAAAV